MNISSNINSLLVNQTSLNVNANNIANVNTDGFKSVQSSTVSNENGILENSLSQSDLSSERSQTDLAKEIPQQISIEAIEEANIEAIRTQDQMLGTLIDLKA